MSSEEELQQWEIDLLSKGMIGNNQQYNINQLKEIQKKELFHDSNDIISYLQKKQQQNTNQINLLNQQISMNTNELQQYQSQLDHLEENQNKRNELFTKYQSICIELNSSISFERKQQLLIELQLIEKELIN